MVKSIRKYILIFIIIIVSFLLQSTIFNYFDITSVTKPNLMLIITCVLGFMLGKNEGLFIGFLCGMLTDIFFGEVIGLNALIYMYIGYFNGLFNKLFYDDNIILPLSLVFCSDFSYNFVYFICRFLLRNKLNFSFYFFNIILPEMIITLVLALIIYKVLYIFTGKFLSNKTRSTLTFD
ncbi:MAG: rod shape-determining protein MreD [Eubacterium sp.]